MTRQFEENSKVCGEIFELLISREPDELRLKVWIEMIEKEVIRRRGYKDGRMAGSWVFDGNTMEESVERIQRGIEEGDPLFLDALPSPRLGGEFADDPTWESILRDEDIRYDSEMDPDGRQDLHDMYVAGFMSGVQDEVMAYGKHSVKA